jgi:hypothetical protein
VMPPRAWADALEQVLEAVDPTRQVAKFVLTGQHGEALNLVKSGHLWVHQAGRRNSDAAKKATAKLYAGFGDVDATVLRRWGRVKPKHTATFVKLACLSSPSRLRPSAPRSASPLTIPRTTSRAGSGVTGLKPRRPTGTADIRSRKSRHGHPRGRRRT